jgi:lysozyme
MDAVSIPPDDLERHLEAQLALEEGRRQLVYDDATGLSITRGMTLKGNLTVGTGINLMTGLGPEELEYIELNRLTKARMSLERYTWYQIQDEVRQVALCDLAFNLGLAGLLRWPKFLSYMQGKDYPSAVAEIRSNQVWVGEVHPARANRIQQMILTGAWPADVEA